MFVEKLLPDIRKRLVCVEPTASLLTASRLLSEGGDMVLVCSDDRCLVGIVTKTDVVRTTGHCTGASCTAPVTGAMTQEVLTTTPHAGLHDVWKTMRDRKLKNLPVLDDDGTVLGVLNALDTLRTLLHEVRNEEALLRDYAMSLGYR